MKTSSYVLISLKRIAVVAVFLPTALSAQVTLTKPASAGGTITGGLWQGTWSAANAFNQTNGDSNRWLVQLEQMNSATNQAYAIYSFDDNTVVNGYAVTALPSGNAVTRNPNAWKLEGSHDISNGIWDDANWELVDEKSGITGWTAGLKLTYETAFTNNYRHYRFTMLADNGATDYVGVQELAYFGYYDYQEAPQISGLTAVRTSADTAQFSASLDAGITVEVFVAWGDSADNLSNTNYLGTVEKVSFASPVLTHTVSGVAFSEVIWFTFFATNELGRAEPEPVSFTMPVNLEWTNAGADDNRWHNPDNWSPVQQVPTIIDPVSIIPNSVAKTNLVIAAPAASAGVTTRTSVNAYMDISADWFVNGTISLNVSDNASRWFFNHTSGTVTIANSFSLTESGRITYDISGSDSALIVSNSFLFNGYRRSTGNVLRISDGARVEVNALTTGGESANAGNPRGAFTDIVMHDNAYLRMRSGSVFGNHEYDSIVSVTNSTVEANNELFVNGILDVAGDSKITVGTLGVNRYRGSRNAHFRQWDGSVNVNTLNIGGAGEGNGASPPTINNRYSMHGGAYTNNSNATIGRRGQGVFEQFGGQSRFNGNIEVKGLHGYCSSLAFYEGAKAHLQGTTTIGETNVSNPGELRVCGAAAQDGNLFINNLTFQTGGRFAPVITESGFAPVHVSGQLRVYEGFTVNPEALENALHGAFTILTWTALNTTTPEQLENWVKIAPGVDSLKWKIVVNAAANKIILRHVMHGTLLIVK